MFAPITLGREHWPGNEELPRHRHLAGYACLILRGGFEEAGDRGHFRTSPGDVVFHRPFEAHLDRISSRGAQAINFRLDGWSGHAMSLAVAADPDRIARLAERNVAEAREALLACVQLKAGDDPDDWPDRLAHSLRENPTVNLTQWAERCGIAPATLSRGFRRVYQISPNGFRAQMRAHRAWRCIVEKQISLSAIAQESGFSDQAHMTRAVGALTGHTPGQWRLLTSTGFKTPA